jgi:hypothetical protein
MFSKWGYGFNKGGIEQPAISRALSGKKCQAISPLFIVYSEKKREVPQIFCFNGLVAFLDKMVNLPNKQICGIVPFTEVM